VRSVAEWRSDLLSRLRRVLRRCRESPEWLAHAAEHAENARTALSEPGPCPLCGKRPATMHCLLCDDERCWSCFAGHTRSTVEHSIRHSAHERAGRSRVRLRSDLSSSLAVDGPERERPTLLLQRSKPI
jgi:hypothetical protein